MSKIRGTSKIAAHRAISGGNNGILCTTVEALEKVHAPFRARSSGCVLAVAVSTARLTLIMFRSSLWVSSDGSCADSGGGVGNW